MVSLSKFVLLYAVQYCFGSEVIGKEIEKQIADSSVDSSKRKFGTEYISLDKDHSIKEDTKKFDKTETDNHSEQQESGHYNEKDEKKNGYNVGQNSVSGSSSFDVGKNEHEKSGNGHERKGYHRSGFANSYHKDESGNKSSFYEDSSDEKTHSNHNSRDQYYGKKAEDSYKDGRYDSSLQGYDRANKGEYAKGERYNKQHGYLGNYNADVHDNGRQNYRHGDSERYSDRRDDIYYRRDYQPRFDPYDNFDYYSRSHSYPLGYSRDFYYNYPSRYYEALSDVDRGSPYYPVNGRHNGNYYDDYYTKQSSNYDNSYFKGYLPNSYHEEYVQVY